MCSLLADFKQAQLIGSGPLLSTTISPIATAEDPNRLRNFSQSFNYSSVAADIRYELLQDRSSGMKLPKNEGNAWVDVYVALWKAVQELLSVEESLPKASWANVFQAYKEVSNLLIRGYSSGGFDAWTVPCLYVAGKYLRMFAIKADAEAQKNGAAAFSDGFQDDVVGHFGNNEKLEDAARTINRMFTLCLSDRYVSAAAASLLIDSQLLKPDNSDRRSKSLGNGAYITRRIFCSKHISRYARP